MSEKLGVGIHGAGWVSTQHIDAFKRNPHTKIVAISSRKLSSCEARAKEAGLTDVKFYTEYQKMLEQDDLDVVSICTPQHLHAREVIQAAEAGKHILIEKPAATSLEDLKAMRDAVRRAKVKTLVGFVLRWNPLFETIKSMIADDFLGNVYYVETDYQSHVGDWWSGWEWAQKKEIAVDSFLVAGCHGLDALRWFAEKDRYKAANIAEVYSYAGGYRKGRDIDWPGFEVMLVKFENGILGKVSSNFDCFQPYSFPISIFGDKGTIKENRVWSRKFPGQTGWVEIPTILPDTPEVTHHPFRGEVDHFVDCILKETESHCNLEDAVNTHEAIFAAMISQERGEKVKLPLLK